MQIYAIMVKTGHVPCLPLIGDLEDCDERWCNMWEENGNVEFFMVEWD
jgi:hypothetical protein